MTRWDYFPMQAGPCAPAPDVQGGWQITSYFGGRTDPITGVPGTHGGQDLAYYGCRGAHIYAPSAGTLAQGWDPSGGGNWSGVTLDDGSYIGIGHALSFAPGDPYRRVGAGELIAYCDSTGGSTGDHVHIAYRPAGSWSYADPYDLLQDSQHRMVGGSYPPDEEDDMPTMDELRLEFTGQTSQPAHKVLSQWEADTRKYKVMIVHDLRTGAYWAVHGLLRLRIENDAWYGWWKMRPDVLPLGDVNGSCWQTAMIDQTIEIFVDGNDLHARLAGAFDPPPPLEDPETDEVTTTAGHGRLEPRPGHTYHGD